MERTYAIQTKDLEGQQVFLQGWVASIRDHGQLLFIDLRDSSGKVQVVLDPEQHAEAFAVAKDLHNEYVIAASGNVRKRQPELVNDKLPTGQIEVDAEQLELLNKSKPLPFPIDGDGRDIDENKRLSYRFVDLRRGRLQKVMQQRSDFLMAVRNWMTKENFLEVTTPLLTSTSPEGARDYVIPSRLHKGKFFVLPQAPQQYKQLLMVGGVDKYFQIAPCARDEDPRADRHAGVFYQIDMEMSFPTQDKLFSTCENLLYNTYTSVAAHKEIVEFPFPRLSYADALQRYGTDKPDIRYGLELQEITELVKDKTEFNVFNQAEQIKCVVAEGCGDWSRTQIEEMETLAKQLGGKGLAYVKVTNEGLDTGIAKFLEPVAQELIESVGARPGDLLFFAADKPSVVNKVLAQVRDVLGDKLELKDPDKLAFVWITDFPFYEQDEDTDELLFGHNPFSMPQGGAEAFETDDPLSIQSHQYDLAVNGYEVLSGSIRNHDPEVLVKAFEVLGYGKEEVISRFGALYNAFQYGAPPHGGWAIGIDRLFMVLVDEPNIRDIYAFPKNSNGMDLMMNAPSEVEAKDLQVLGVQLAEEVKLAKEQEQQHTN